MGASISTGRLFDRRDVDNAFKSIGYYLITAVKYKDDDGCDCVVDDVEAVSSRKVNTRIVVALESMINDMIQDATTCFPHRAPRTGAQRGISLLAPATASASTLTPQTRRTVSDRSNAAVITPEKASIDGAHLSSRVVTNQSSLAFNRSGSPAHLRRLFVEDALQLKGGDEVVYVMKVGDVGAGLLAKLGVNKSTLVEEVGFFRGCCKYVQVQCVVKNNPKGAQYVRDLWEHDRNELIDFVSKGEGLT
eukprot:CAMPEP_0197726092 /NCGR_PEP_ID=MMETSP1434-20131217/13541_1 /TAXON_ID=265543 /ORGANISM="Minutocellus polymorphus, Strain CCMP3303" /LENGTH=247 /DNA_ID=CAMNT_0043311911 /DNA_START=79 /DNA_END=818 /DNA_ORIENTATION=+